MSAHEKLVRTPQYPPITVETAGDSTRCQKTGMERSKLGVGERAVVKGKAHAGLEDDTAPSPPLELLGAHRPSTTSEPVSFL